MDLLRRLSMGLGLLVGLALLCLGTPINAAPEKSDSKVKITAEASKPDAEGRQMVVFKLVIEKGWHLYANPVGNPDYENAKTSVAIKAAQPLKNAKIDYPPGQVEKDDLGNYNIYEGTVVIKAQVQRTSGDETPLDVSIDVQACSHKLGCLLPATVKLTVK